MQKWWRVLANDQIYEIKWDMTWSTNTKFGVLDLRVSTSAKKKRCSYFVLECMGKNKEAHSVWYVWRGSKKICKLPFSRFRENILKMDRIISVLLLEVIFLFYIVFFLQRVYFHDVNLHFMQMLKQMLKLRHWTNNDKIVVNYTITIPTHHGHSNVEHTCWGPAGRDRKNWWLPHISHNNRQYQDSEGRWRISRNIL